MRCALTVMTGCKTRDAHIHEVLAALRWEMAGGLSCISSSGRGTVLCAFLLRPPIELGEPGTYSSHIHYFIP